MSKDCFFLPYQRGFLVFGHDTTPTRNPYENPLTDTFYTYAPLYGAFSSATGEFLDSTIGELNSSIGQAYGIGFARHHVGNLACDYETGLCAWVQWLVPEITLSNGRSIPLEHYWNPAMISTSIRHRRYSLPLECERSVLYDSAGAKVVGVILTPKHVYVSWHVKERGVPLGREEGGFRVIQKYDIATARCVGQWSVPSYYRGQRLRNIMWNRQLETVVGLYQGALETTLVYYNLDELSTERR